MVLGTSKLQRSLRKRLSSDIAKFSCTGPGISTFNPEGNLGHCWSNYGRVNVVEKRDLDKFEAGGFYEQVR